MKTKLFVTTALACLLLTGCVARQRHDSIPTITRLGNEPLSDADIAREIGQYPNRF